jgi:hypothetical protein
MTCYKFVAVAQSCAVEKSRLDDDVQLHTSLVLLGVFFCFVIGKKRKGGNMFGRLRVGASFSRSRKFSGDLIRLKNFVYLGVFALCLVLTSVCNAQNAPADAKSADPTAPPATPPMPLGQPSITGPLSGLPPANFDAGPLGKISVNGIVAGGGTVQSNAVPGDNKTQASLTNGQVFIQKADGIFQFYVQAGAYNMPALATPFTETDKTISNFYGPVPVGFVKVQAGKNTSYQIGSLPTLIGAEYTFTFENMNIQRGLLWNQENAVTRGMQLNQTMGKVTASLAWTDGFYSNRYTWLSGSLTYTNGAHSLGFVAGGNYKQTAFQTAATPVQNNSDIYDIIYTYNKNGWIIQPYFQYTKVPDNLKIGIPKGGSTTGGAILVSRAFKHGFSLPGRWEYIANSGDKGALDLLGSGIGSKATSVTVTPTFQYGGFFFRGDIAVVHGINTTPGTLFGPKGLDVNQARAVAEIGFIFGNNIEK